VIAFEYFVQLRLLTVPAENSLSLVYMCYCETIT